MAAHMGVYGTPAKSMQAFTPVFAGIAQAMTSRVVGVFKKICALIDQYRADSLGGVLENCVPCRREGLGVPLIWRPETLVLHEGELSLLAQEKVLPPPAIDGGLPAARTTSWPAG